MVGGVACARRSTLGMRQLRRRHFARGGPPGGSGQQAPHGDGSGQEGPHGVGAFGAGSAREAEATASTPELLHLRRWLLPARGSRSSRPTTGEAEVAASSPELPFLSGEQVPGSGDGCLDLVATA